MASYSEDWVTADEHSLMDHSNEVAEKELNQLIVKSGIGDYLNTGVPVDIEKIARSVGAISIRKADIPAAGMLIPTDDSFMILLNRNHNSNRQRFSCAHEIAHALIDPSYSMAQRQLPASNGVNLERKCENLAAMLLMPTNSFSACLESYGNHLKTIIKLSQIFLTSIQSTAIRFVDLVKEPCVLIISELKSGKSGRKLRVRWSYQNTLRHDGKPIYFIPRGKSTNINTATIAYQTGQTQSDIVRIDIGDLRINAHAESKGLGFGKTRYVMTLVFPSR